MLIHMAEYCDTPESKDRINREYKACLREGAIPRLLDHDVTHGGDGHRERQAGGVPASRHPHSLCLYGLSKIGDILKKAQGDKHASPVFVTCNRDLSLRLERPHQQLATSVHVTSVRPIDQTSKAGKCPVALGCDAQKEGVPGFDDDLVTSGLQCGGDPLLAWVPTFPRVVTFKDLLAVEPNGPQPCSRVEEHVAVRFRLDRGDRLYDLIVPIGQMGRESPGSVLMKERSAGLGQAP
jgi:hypothetical protein